MDAGWAISLIIQIFIAYHVFFLSKRISNREKLQHKDTIKNKAEELLWKVRQSKINSEVYLVNIKRYFKDYPSNTEKRFEGYSHIKAEIKATRFDGIEFFAEPPVQVYQRSDGSLSFRGSAKEKAFNAFPVGVVPYEWIEHIDIEGDEYAFVPLFYCYFKGRTNWKFWKRFQFYGYPYKKMYYYRLNDGYDARSDPSEMKFIFINEPISKS